MNFRLFLHLTWCLFSIFLSSVQAGVITINQTASASIKENNLNVEINVSNTGDTSASNLIPRIVFLGKTHSLSTVKTLEAGSSFKQSINLSLGDESRGEFHILSLVAYDDDKKDRHSNAAEMYLNTVPIAERPLKLSVKTISNDNLSNHSTLTLENSHSNSLEIRLQFVTAETIAINQKNKQFSLLSGEKLSIPIILNSNGFKELGSKPLFVIARYSKDALNYSQLISISPQEIDEGGVVRSFFSSQIFVVVIVGLLILIVLIVLLINLKKRNQA